MGGSYRRWQALNRGHPAVGTLVLPVDVKGREQMAAVKTF
jgi:hypothetical protein